MFQGRTTLLILHILKVVIGAETQPKEAKMIWIGFFHDDYLALYLEQILLRYAILNARTYCCGIVTATETYTFRLSAFLYIMSPYAKCSCHI